MRADDRRGAREGDGVVVSGTGHGSVVPTHSSRPLMIEGFAVRHGGGTRVVLANLTRQEREVAPQGLADRARARLLDGTTAEETLLAPERFCARGGEGLPGGGGARTIRCRPTRWPGSTRKSGAGGDPAGSCLGRRGHGDTAMLDGRNRNGRPCWRSRRAPPRD
ncbi:MAG: hypothetical protein AVDCRST_MAG88-914 [uncultured Thermomicrobiales bacterium]|uniref:D-apionate lactonase C-terminal domain-containing protein n=1 Tax=uncultured Thermomicrobiales bacterium TaxID=1645740 RepID=A0A6J4UPF4_9BACT|nr:MAG: hypothetical protein AVDCRST_MAG88-914 [uncultured Thermomicrobiales bacterium]